MSVLFVTGIEQRKCAWCGEAFVRLATTKRPIITCSAACRRDNDLDVRARVARNYRKRCGQRKVPR